MYIQGTTFLFVLILFYSLDDLECCVCRSGKFRPRLSPGPPPTVRYCIATAFVFVYCQNTVGGIISITVGLLIDWIHKSQQQHYPLIMVMVKEVCYYYFVCHVILSIIILNYNGLNIKYLLVYKKHHTYLELKYWYIIHF